jgi:hypothetical protein
MARTETLNINDQIRQQTIIREERAMRFLAIPGIVRGSGLVRIGGENMYGILDVEKHVYVESNNPNILPKERVSPRTS